VASSIAPIGVRKLTRWRLFMSLCIASAYRFQVNINSIFISWVPAKLVGASRLKQRGSTPLIRKAPDPTNQHHSSIPTLNLSAIYRLPQYSRWVNRMTIQTTTGFLAPIMNLGLIQRFGLFGWIVLRTRPLTLPHQLSRVSSPRNI
jgi:hypothetical protein